MNLRSTFDSAASAGGFAERIGEDQLRSLVSNLPVAVYRREHSKPWTMVFVSDYLEVLTGYPASEFTSERVRSFVSIVCVEDRARVSEAVESALRREGSFAVEYRVLDSDGAYRWVEEHGRSVLGPDGLPLWIDGVIVDLSAHKEAEQFIGGAEALARHRLGHDTLTSLPDRTLIRDRLQQLLLRSQREHELIAAMLVDLDHFQAVNERLGTEGGDELLKAVAGRLMGVLRASDTIGRPRGDEFAILAEGLSLSGGPELLAERLLESLREPFLLEGFDDCPLSVTASIGFATNETDEPEDLLRDAAIALCQAKARGRNCHVRFAPTMKTAAMERLELETDMREGLQENQFLLAYQPVFELDSVGVWGVEAYLRWRHPVRGLVDPEYFVPVLEETEMSIAVGYWALRQACRQAVAWQRLGHDLVMSINVSARQLEEDDFVGQLRHVLDAAALEPSSLVLDIAEPTLARVEGIAPRLRELEETGVLVAVEGLGADSSASRLRELAIGAVKIDPSYLAALSDSREAVGSLQRLLEECRELGLQTFAEGIRHGWQLATLQKERCRFGQGPYFSQPIPPEALEAILSLEPLFA